MCVIDFDPASVSSTKDHTARKAHKCSECCRAIAPGERYRNSFGVWEGHADTFKTCAHCCVGQDWLIKNCNGYMHEGLQEEMQEHADEYRHVRFRMLRIVVGMRHRWKRFDGTGLLALQPMPQPIDEAHLW